MSLNNTAAVEVAQAFADRVDGWTVETPYDHAAQLVHSDGLTLYVRQETYGPKVGKVCLSAGVPEGVDYSAGDYHGLDRPEIFVSPDRPGDVLARDIQRRLIDSAQVYWDAISERIASRNSARSARESLAQELATIMGGTVSSRPGRVEERAETPRAMRGGERYAYGYLTPDYRAEDVNVELHNLSPEQAREVASMIARWAGR